MSELVDNLRRSSRRWCRRWTATSRVAVFALKPARGRRRHGSPQFHRGVDAQVGVGVERDLERAGHIEDVANCVALAVTGVACRGGGRHRVRGSPRHSDALGEMFGEYLHPPLRSDGEDKPCQDAHRGRSLALSVRTGLVAGPIQHQHRHPVIIAEVLDAEVTHWTRRFRCGGISFNVQSLQ